MRMKIEGPWGKTDHDLDDFESLIKFGYSQLKYFRDVKGNNSDYLNRDIEGYEAILNSNNPIENAKNFISTKHRILNSGTHYKDNLNVIEIMKTEGTWVG